MKRYSGTEKVKPGLYFNVRQLSFKSMDEEGDLPGTPMDEYLQVPTVAMLVVGPILGLVYVLFLPFIGFAMVGGLAAAKAAGFVGRAAAAGARVLQPAWQPAMAFLSRRGTGRKSRKAARREGRAAPTGEQARDAWAEGVRKELDADDEEQA
jgi:hypothetical protein